MPFLARITNTFFISLINRLGVRPPPPEGFELSNIVQPVSIVDADIAIAAVSTTPLLGVPATIGESAAPATATVLADTGPLAVGNWDVTIWVDSDDDNVVIPSLSFVQIQRRDAANAISIWSQLIKTTDVRIMISFRTSLLLNERIRVIKLSNASALTTYQASIFSTVST